MKISRVVFLVLIIMVLLVFWLICDNGCSKNSENNMQTQSESNQSDNIETQENPSENYDVSDEADMQSETVTVSCPWVDEGTKQPSDYTWEEYEALSSDQKTEFFEWFPTSKEFDDWLMENQEEPDLGENQGMPWDEPYALQPDEYSYDQYEALTGEQQVAFIDWFPTTKEFDDWLMANEPELDLGE